MTRIIIMCIFSLFSVSVWASEQETIHDLEALHAATLKYLKAHDGVWPQPDATALEDAPGLLEFWKEALRPYGATADDWRNSKDPVEKTFSYIPSFFDSAPGTPTKWIRQPWFIRNSLEDAERALLITSDGRIFRINDLAKIRE